MGIFLEWTSMDRSGRFVFTLSFTCVSTCAHCSRVTDMQKGLMHAHLHVGQVGGVRHRLSIEIILSYGAQESTSSLDCLVPLIHHANTFIHGRVIPHVITYSALSSIILVYMQLAQYLQVYKFIRDFMVIHELLRMKIAEICIWKHPVPPLFMHVV